MITHTPENQDAIDEYTTFSWNALCEAVLAIPVQVRTTADVVHLPAVARAHAEPAVLENPAQFGRALGRANRFPEPSAGSYVATPTGFEPVSLP
jgi:hypothetical protein